MVENELTPRQRETLKTLIQEYIASGVPVGSATIQQVGRLGVSSATIRNELAALEEMEYIAQPHTSAGRMPTVKGYRYFVEQLMEQSELSPLEKRMIGHQFHQVRLDLEQWLKLTAAVLAHTVQAASVVTPPRASESRFRHLELISISDALCLMILVLQDGSIHQEMLGMVSPLDQGTLSQTSNKLNARLLNRSVEEIQVNADPELAVLQDWEAQVLQRIVDQMPQVDRMAITDIYRDGLVNVLEQPELSDANTLRQIMAILEHRGLLESVFDRILNANGVQIIIGGEGLNEMDDVSMVLSPYGVRNRATGILGVLGPTRMRYARAISTVRYVAHLMDAMISELYGL